MTPRGTPKAARVVCQFEPVWICHVGESRERELSLSRAVAAVGADLLRFLSMLRGRWRGQNAALHGKAGPLRLGHV